MKKMQIKGAMSYHLPPIRMVVIKQTKSSKCWQESGGERTIIYWVHCGRCMEVLQNNYSNPTTQYVGNGNEINISERHLHSHAYCRDIYDKHNRANLSVL